MEHFATFLDVLSTLAGAISIAWAVVAHARGF